MGCPHLKKKKKNVIVYGVPQDFFQPEEWTKRLRNTALMS
jgi:hypothetical protein